MIRSTVHLIGGGPGTMLAFRRHLRAALPEMPRGKKPLVAYVGAASGDDRRFLGMIGAEVALAGGRVKAAKLASPRSKRSLAQGVLEDCDLVFVSGGDVDAGMNVLNERDMLPVFRALGRAGRPMVGLSAGSIMLARSWVRFPEGHHERPSVFACMGLAPVYVDAHAEGESWEELCTLLRLVAEDGDARPIGFGLTRLGGLRVEQAAAPRLGKGATTHVKVIPFGTPAPRFGVTRGRVVARAPLALGSSGLAKTPPRTSRRRATHS